MASKTNPFRGANLCHRLELPSRPRSRRNPAALTRHARIEYTPPPRVILRPIEAAAPRPDPGIELLERRLAKVKALLELREGELQRLNVAGEIEPGLASAHREVQGLEGDSDLVQRKREMMVLIFEANLELQRKLRPGPHSGAPGGR